MSQSQTSGYDILVQLSEEELNAQLETSFGTRTVTTTFNSLTVIAVLTFKRLELDITIPTFTNGVRLFLDADVKIGSGPFTTYTPEIVASLGVVRDVTIDVQTLVIFTIDPHTVDAALLSEPLVPEVRGVPLPVALALRAKLLDLRYIEIGPAIHMPDSSNPLEPTDLHVKVIDDSNANGIDCVTFMLNTGGSTGGNPLGVTTYLGAGPTGAVVTLSNHLVLARLIRPRLASALGANFVAPCVLDGVVSIFSRSGHGIFHSIDINVDLESMSVVVEDNHLRVMGTVGGSGTGFSVSGSFYALLYIELGSNGMLHVRQDDVQLTANVSFAVWVWALVALTGGSLAVLLTAAIQAAIGPVIAGLLTEFAAFASYLGNGGIAIPSIPLGPAGGQLTIQSVLLDDLTLQGPVTRIPVVAAGLAIQGHLHVSHTDSTTLINGVPLTGILLLQPGLHIVTTRRLAYRGLFSAVLSQPVIPATFVWSWGGTPISGTGTRVVSQEGAHGTRDDVTTYFQVEGAHCWIWTPVGTTLVGLPLSLTLIDGAGHHSTASAVLSCEGIIVTDFITQPFDHLISDAAADPSHIVATATVEWLLQNPGVITPAIDRKKELSAAFQRGLTAKRDAGPATGKSTTDKPTTTK